MHAIMLQALSGNYLIILDEHAAVYDGACKVYVQNDSCSDTNIDLYKQILPGMFQSFTITTAANLTK